MASKGPKSDVPAKVTKPAAEPAVATAKPAVAPIAAKAIQVAPKPAAKPAPVATKSAPVASPAPPAPKPVAKAADVPVAPKPAVTATAPVAAATPAPVPAPKLEVPTPIAAPAAPLQKEVQIMATTFQSAAENAQAQAKTLFGDVNDRAKTALAKGSKAFEEMNDFSKGNVEAIVESTKIAAKGAEDIAKYTTEYVKASVEKATANAKQFAAVKSPTELFKLQSDHAKEAMDAMMAETAKFTENYLKLLGEIAQPISNRMALAAEKMKIAA